MSNDFCVFCQIARQRIPVPLIFEWPRHGMDYPPQVVAFHAKDPQAPTHVIITLGEHYKDFGEVPPYLMSEVAVTVQEVVKQLNITLGYRLVVNTGRDAGQTVTHFHMHLLAGGPLGDICTEFRS